MITRFYRYEQGGGKVPAVNVKVPPLFDRLPKELQAAPDTMHEQAFQSVQEDWWNLQPQSAADEILGPVFKGAKIETSADGRSAGYVIVVGLGDIEEWTDDQRAAWDRFEAAIKQSMVDAEDVFQKELRRLIEEATEAAKPETRVKRAVAELRKALAVMGLDAESTKPIVPARYMELTRLFDAADDEESLMLQHVAVKAGFLWRCESSAPDASGDCMYYNDVADWKCDACGAARPTEEHKPEKAGR